MILQHSTTGQCYIMTKIIQKKKLIYNGIFLFIIIIVVVCFVLFFGRYFSLLFFLRAVNLCIFFKLIIKLNSFTHLKWLDAFNSDRVICEEKNVRISIICPLLSPSSSPPTHNRHFEGGERKKCIVFFWVAFFFK